MIGSGVGGRNAVLQTSTGTNVVGLSSSKANPQNTLFNLSSNTLHSNKNQDKELLAIQAKELEERNKKVWKPWWK